jgi:hypothetical protein
MIFNRDFFEQMEIPAFNLCKANGEYLGTIECIDQKTLVIDELNEIQFKTPKYFDDYVNPLYDMITEMKYVNLPGMFNFVITSVEEDDDGVNPIKSVTAKSVEANLGQRYLEEFYVNTGEDFAVNNVCLYDPAHPERSLLNLVLDEKCPDWSVAYVDADIMGKQRYFEVERQDIYGFLTGELAEAFDAVVLFDSNNYTISVYKEENYGSDTNVFISYDNLLQNAALTSSSDDIKTCMTVMGAEDLNLREVNMGSDRIYMLDYYATPEFMSEDCCDAYAAWKSLIDENKPIYAGYVNECINLYDEINYLTNEKMPLGGENLIHVDNSTATINGVTFTVNSTDGTISVNGTASEETEFIITDNLASYLTEETIYRFIGCPLQDLDNVEFYMQWYNKDDPSSKLKRNSIDDGSGNQMLYEAGVNRLSIFVKSGKTVTNKVFEPNIYLPDSKNTDWTKYGLVPLQEQLASYEAQQAVMAKAGQGNPDNPDYETMYLPCCNTIDDIKEQIVVVQAQLDALYHQLDVIQENMYLIYVECAMNNNFTEEQIIELSKFIREESINSDNYVITDEMTDAERIEMLEDMLEYGEEELRKVSQPQIQFTTDIVNLFNIKEFDAVSADFNRGNFIHIILRDDYVVKARLVSMSFDFYDLGKITVTFSNVNKTVGKTLFTDISKAINTSSSVSTTVSVKSSYWNEANREATELNSVIDSGYLSANKAIQTSSADVKIDDNGILLTSTDPEYPNDRVLIGGSRILFSDDDLKTVKEAIGRVKYTTSDGVEHDEFGVLAQFMLAGYINGATIDAGTINVGGQEDGKIIIYDANGSQIGCWDKDGIVLPPNVTLTWDNIAGNEILGRAVRVYLDQYNNTSDISAGLAMTSHYNFGNNYDYQQLQMATSGFVATSRKDVSTSSTPSTQTDYKYYQINIGKISGTPVNFSIVTRTGYVENAYKYVADPDDNESDRQRKHAAEILHTHYNNDTKTVFKISEDGQIYSYDASGNYVSLGNGKAYLFTNGAEAIPYFYGFDNGGMNVGIGTAGLFHATKELTCGDKISQIVQTENHGDVKMKAVGSQSASFQYCGSSAITSGGSVTVNFDATFEETVDLSQPYQVFITNTSSTLTTYVEKNFDSIVVHGSNGATFDYMIVAKQK